MFKGSEPPDAISFTDETSRENKEKTTRRVWTHAQVSKFDTLAWFKEFRGLYPEIDGELKSSQVVNNFEKLPRDVKLRVSSGIRNARIHIVDTFAYEAEYKQILRGIYKCDNYEKMLQTSENQVLTKAVITRMEDFVAESILLDSPAQRLERSLQARRLGGYGYYSALAEQEQYRKELSTDLKPFRKGKKKVYDTATKWVSKSGSVFADAVEYAGHGFFGEYEARQHVAEMLNASHAFDDGDDSSIEWIKNQRDHFVTNTVYQTFGHLKPLYGEIDSKLSPRTQAADIAARIAQRDYDEYGLEGVLNRFDYVTFNGERITERNVRERLDYWNGIVEREEKIQKLVAGL